MIYYIDDENIFVCFDDNNTRMNYDPLFECWNDIQSVAVQIGSPIAL